MHSNPVRHGDNCASGCTPLTSKADNRVFFLSHSTFNNSKTCGILCAHPAILAAAGGHALRPFAQHVQDAAIRARKALIILIAFTPGLIRIPGSVYQNKL
jgi:hypothetical protein